MIPASYLFKDVHDHHWGAGAPVRESKAEDAYYTSVSGSAIAITRLVRHFSDAAQSALASARHPRSTSQTPQEAACRT